MLDAFFITLNNFDNVLFYCLIPVAIWLGWGWRPAAKVFFILVVSRITNVTLKEIFHIPRPCQIDPSLGLIPIQGFSFPSGAAQVAFLLSSLLLSYSKTVWTLSFSVLYVGLISYSRLYLGVHFPSDILGGWLVGYILFLFYKRLNRNSLDLLRN